MQQRTRLANVLTELGVANIEFFDAEIHDLETGVVHTTHVAFNIVGAIAAADLGKSVFDASESGKADFDLLMALTHNTLYLDFGQSRVQRIELP